MDIPGRRNNTFEGTEMREGNVHDTMREEMGHLLGRGPRDIRKFGRGLRMGLSTQEIY